MGYYITYSLKLHIKAKNISKALEIFNHLHDDDMLVKYARGGSNQGKTIKETHWYSWVLNPEKPYTSLEEAFGNWRIVEECVEYNTDPVTGDFTISGKYGPSGKYDSKWGQQDFLIKMLAPVLENTRIEVTGEDGMHYNWIVTNHKYSSEQFESD